MKIKRRALIVGLDSYKDPAMKLDSAVKDARAIAVPISSHQDGSANYDCRLWLDRTDDGQPITRRELRRGLEDLFRSFRGDTLFYFSGHGTIGPLGGHLITADGEPGDWGISLDEILRMATNSEANDILLVLDCCNGGDLGELHLQPLAAGMRSLSTLREDMTLMAASMPQESSFETANHGLFTSAVLNALDGGAADPMGWVTAPAIYASVERRFGAWPQQPVYKSNATRVSLVRQCAPQVARNRLQKLTEIFKTQNTKLRLDPQFEAFGPRGSARKRRDLKKEEVANVLREYRDAGLVRTTIEGEQIYWAAFNSHTVELTPRGREYWTLIKLKKI